MQIRIALAKAKRLLGMTVLAVAVASPIAAYAQEAEEGEEGENLEPAAPDEKATPVQPGPAATPPAIANLPAPPPPPAAPPSPFSFAIKGFVSGSIMAQDVASASGNYNLFLFGPTRPANAPTDKWFYGGDVRQSQLKFFITGPTLIGATPMAGFDFDLLGGNQINSVPGAVVPISQFNAMTMMNGAPLGFAPTGTSAQGDENILPRVRLAYLELNWGGGADILRIGQFHNLLVPMIAASLGHIGAPLGYGAGQLGWRAPGITYQHTFKLSDTVGLAASIQLNRNNWADNVPTCPGTPPTGSPPTATSAMNNCVPNGVSLAEASMLPQVQARLMLSGPPKPSPFPMYAPNAWQVYVVGVWDQKDASGFGAKAAMGNDTLSTTIVEGGFKVGLGPVLLAGNAWYGKNAGSAFGHIFTMQHPSAGDITGFGAWGQIGFNLTPELALWWFTGIDKPNEADIRKTSVTGAGYIQNIQMVAQLSYVVGPLAFSLEYMRIMSDLALPAVAALNLPQSVESASANQIALSGAFFF